MMIRKAQSTLILLKKVKWRHETISISTEAYKTSLNCWMSMFCITGDNGKWHKINIRSTSSFGEWQLATHISPLSKERCRPIFQKIMMGQTQKAVTSWSMGWFISMPSDAVDMRAIKHPDGQSWVSRIWTRRRCLYAHQTCVAYKDYWELRP